MAYVGLVCSTAIHNENQSTHVFIILMIYFLFEFSVYK